MKTERLILKTMLLAILLIQVGQSFAFLKPTDANRAPLLLVRENIKIAINGETAETRVELTYRNPHGVQLEGDFLFPLPKDATVSDFTLTWNGRRIHGEILDAEEARRIYEQIVRRRRDPGLIRYIDGRLFHARVFPFPAKSDRTVEITYVQILETEGTESRYTFPLRASRPADRAIEDLTLSFTVDGRGQRPDAYSPTHSIDTVRENQGRLSGGFETRSARPEGDFMLYLPPPGSLGQVTFSAVTYDAPGEEGYFLLNIVPPADPEASALPKDVVFVMDTSSSLTTNHLEASVRALAICLRNLAPEDRFGLVRFSTGVQSFRGNLVRAEPGALEAAMEYAARFRPAGGTNLSAALQAAYRLRTSVDRPFYVILLTDGAPTVGERDPKRITADRPTDSPTIRVMTIGLGDEVNTHLLDILAEESGGASIYLPKETGFEEKMISFISRLDHPVLLDVRLTLAGVGASDLYPQEIPDLFAGEATRVLGRFGNAGEARIIMEGKRGGRNTRFAETIRFRKDSGNDFLPPLWARRKIAHLLDTIRLHGEEKETVDEVKTLATRFGIITPYTSSLIIEDESMLDRRERGFLPPIIPPILVPMLERSSGTEFNSDFIEGLPVIGRDYIDALTLAPGVWNKKALPEPKDEDDSPVRHVGGKTFWLRDGVWVENSYRADQETREVVFGTDEYFRLSRISPEVRKILALGERVLFRWDGVFYKVVPTP